MTSRQRKATVYFQELFREPDIPSIIVHNVTAAVK